MLNNMAVADDSATPRRRSRQFLMCSSSVRPLSTGEDELRHKTGSVPCMDGVEPCSSSSNHDELCSSVAQQESDLSNQKASILSIDGINMALNPTTCAASRFFANKPKIIPSQSKLHSVASRVLANFTFVMIVLVVIVAQQLSYRSSVVMAQVPPLCSVLNDANQLTADVTNAGFGPPDVNGKLSVTLSNIVGAADQLQLTIVPDSPYATWFSLNGKDLSLIKNLDNQRAVPEHITLKISCVPVPLYGPQRPLQHRVVTPKMISVSEMTPVGTTIYQANPRGPAVGNMHYEIINPEALEYFTLSNPSQGWIALRRPLDYETHQQYNIRIRATDGTNQEETTVTVRVQDGNDQDPAFEYNGCQRVQNVCINPVYEALVERMQKDVTLRVQPEAVRAFDRDTLKFPIQYSIMPDPAGSTTCSEYLSIQPDTAAIQVVKPIEMPAPADIVCHIKAEEVIPPQSVYGAPRLQPRYSVATLNVKVTHRNLYPPLIRVPVTTCYVPENAVVGTRLTIGGLGHENQPLKLTIFDQDLAPNERARYRFRIAGPAAQYLRVTPEGFVEVFQPGMTHLANEIGIGGGGAITVVITCVELDTPEQRISEPLQLTIHIKSINSHAPAFAKYNTIDVRAGPPGARQVVTVHAVDQDANEYGHMTYSIVDVVRVAVSVGSTAPVPARQVFSIDPISGQILLQAPVYQGEAYEITCRATDSGGRYDTVLIRVKIIDDGRNEPPYFVNPSYAITVPEGLPVHSPILVVTARDPDGNPLLYRFIAGNEAGKFAIDAATGGIHNVLPLVFEEQDRYLLTVEAKDVPHGLAATAQVEIRIADVNNHEPEILNPLPIVFEAPENQANIPVGVIRARDRDHGPNGELLFSLQAPSEHFRIDERTGEIFVTQPLDFERAKEHTLVITVRDHGLTHPLPPPPAGGVNVLVPVGQPPPPPPPQSIIPIPPPTGTPRVATVVVVVRVIDVEDESPIFTDRVYYAEVHENRPPGIQIVQVRAVDPDAQQRITYRIVSGDQTAFRIDAQSGVISTVKKLDFEQESRYTLTVGTLENTQNNPSSTATVYISVINENDDGPRFVGGPYVASIDTDTPVNSIIYTVLARDGGEPSQIRYSIDGVQPGGGPLPFAIDPVTGAIRVIGDLGPDAQRQYVLRVVARVPPPPLPAGGVNVIVPAGQPPPPPPPQSIIPVQPPAETTVTINVIRPGTVAPVGPVGFALRGYIAEVDENASPNTLVEVLEIRNKPPGPLPSLQCNILEGNQGSHFSVNINGEQNCEIRTTNVPINFEENPQFELLVEMIMNANGDVIRDQAVVRIKVVNMNDHSPTFVFPFPQLTQNRYFTAIDAQSLVGAPVITVLAFDDDRGEFGTIRYVLPRSRVASMFNINAETGVITLARTFGDSNNGIDTVEPFEFPVEARDNRGDQPFRSSQAAVIVNQINDPNRFILVMEGVDPTTIQGAYRENIIRALQDRTNYIIGIERIAPRMVLGQGTTPVEDRTGTDVWMYAIDPRTRRILTRDQLFPLLLQTEEKSRRLAEINTVVNNTQVRAVDIREPFEQPLGEAIVAPVYGSDFSWGLIVLAALIILLGLLALLALIWLWRRFMALLKRRKPPPTRYETMVYEPPTPEYETQVLQMNVQEDPHEIGEVNVDFTPKGGIGNVNYVRSNAAAGTAAAYGASAAAAQNTGFENGYSTAARRSTTNMQAYSAVNDMPIAATTRRSSLSAANNNNNNTSGYTSGRELLGSSEGVVEATSRHEHHHSSLRTQQGSTQAATYNQQQQHGHLVASGREGTIDYVPVAHDNNNNNNTSTDSTSDEARGFVVKPARNSNKPVETSSARNNNLMSAQYTYAASTKRVVEQQQQSESEADRVVGAAKPPAVRRAAKAANLASSSLYTANQESTGTGTSAAEEQHENEVEFDDEDNNNASNRRQRRRRRQDETGSAHANPPQQQPQAAYSYGYSYSRDSQHRIASKL